ncbi:MAG: vWA domain-containing protein [Acidobacteriota bacterium]
MRPNRTVSWLVLALMTTTWCLPAIARPGRLGNLRMTAPAMSARGDTGNTLEPAMLTFEGDACSCFTATSVATVAEAIQQADIMLAIDLTGSMFEERDELINNINGIILDIESFIPDVAFGLISYKDYPSNAPVNTPCPYSSTYGGGTDYPFQLEQAITTDDALVTAAVGALPPASGGSDAPESYNRILLEAYDNPILGWRAGSRRVLVNFGDEMPHDCNVLECLGGTSGTDRGIDLGRDGIPDSGDELATLDQIDGLVDDNVVLIHFDSSPTINNDGGFSYQQIWDCWAAQTGGQAVKLNTDGTPQGGANLPELIADIVGEVSNFCESLSLKAEPGFEEWLTNAGPVYPDVEGPATREFDIEICVPEDTPPGVYTFDIILDCDGDDSATQTVEVTVVDDGDPCCGIDCAELDYSGVSAGDVVTSLPGIPSITALGASGGTNVVAYDTAVETCEDDDLVINQGLALVIQEDTSSCVPDDDGFGGTMTLTFDPPVEIGEVVLVDIDELGTTVIARDAGGSVLASVNAPASADGGTMNVMLDVCGVTELEIEFGGSGALLGLQCTDRLGLLGGLPIQFQRGNFRP